MIPLADQLACARRELRRRVRVLPKLVTWTRVSELTAQKELEYQAAIVATLEAICLQQEGA